MTSGWVELRPNGRSRARYRAPDGTVVSATFDLKRDAREWLAEQLGDVSRGAWVDPRAGRQPFTVWADEWADAQDWKASTRAGWPWIRARLDTRIGRLQLAAIDRMVLLRLRRDLADDYAPATAKLTMTYARMVLRAAYAARRIGHDPTVGIREKRIRSGEPDGRVTPDMVPTRVEALAILAGTPLEWRVGTALGLAGLRISEMLGLTADRVDLAARRVTVDRQASRDGWTTPKTEKPRTVTVPGIVAVELRRHLRDRPDGLLVAAPRGGMMRQHQWAAVAWRPALTAAGLVDEDADGEPVWRFRFHALRHWCASTMLAQGAPITAVAGHLGDTVQTVSRTYAHWLRDDQDVPADVLDQALAPPTESAAGASAPPGGAPPRSQ